MQQKLDNYYEAMFARRRAGEGESILSVCLPVKREGHVTSMKSCSGSVRNYGIARSALANLENLRNCVLRTTKT